MGVRVCQCPERLADFIGQEVEVSTVCGNNITGTLEEVTDKYIEISSFTEDGPVMIIVLCSHLCSVSIQPA